MARHRISQSRRPGGVAVALLLVTALAFSARTEAQSPDPAVSLVVGGGVGHSFHGDFDYYAPAVEAGLTVRVSPRVHIDLAVGSWRRTQEEGRLDVPILGPTGPTGRIGRLEERTRQAFTVAEVNVMGLARVGRARLLAGGGAGVMTLSRVFRQTSSDCSGTTTCGTFENRFSSVSPVVQGVGRLEVPIGGRLSAYAAARLFVNLRDVGGSGTRFTGGITAGF